MPSQKVACPLFRAALLAAALLSCAAGEARAQRLKVSTLTKARRVGEVCEFSVTGLAETDNPYDPNEAALEAVFIAPSGRRTTVPGFYAVPHRRSETPPPQRFVRELRIGADMRNVRAGTVLEMLVDDVRLLDSRSGKAITVDDLAGPLRWRSEDRSVAVAIREQAGDRALHVKWTADRPAWPAVGLDCGGADWRAFDRIRLRVLPLAGHDAMKRRPDIGPFLQLRMAPNHWVTMKLRTGGFQPGKWQQITQPIPRLHARIRFTPAGRGGWRVRFLPSEAGGHKVKLTFRGRGRGVRRGRGGFYVGAGRSDGVVRLSKADPRFLEFTSGRPFFGVGANLVYWKQELGYYRHYLDRLAEARCNLVRTWLSPGCLGFELRGGRYDMARAAQFDELLEMCRRRGLHVMICLADFREVGKKHGTWNKSVYNAANGGPCKSPEAFFSDPAARELFRRRARYALARWAAFPNVLAWELFNEVNLAEAWKKQKDAVREWHGEMGGYVAGLAPYGRPVTTSLSGEADDELWARPQMAIAQRHFYLDPRESFAATAAAAVEKLTRHRKPVLIGEFGRSGNEYAREDAAGVSLHNGLWASALNGSAAAAMSWYWGWIDDNGLWKQLEWLGRFVAGVGWPGEGFRPLRGRISADDGPAARRLPVRVIPVRGKWKPAPVNRPVTVTLREDNTIDLPDRVSKLLHGSLKEKLHNPVTFRVRYAQAGRFIVHVDEVAEAGGWLVLVLDGRRIPQKPFPDLRPPDKRKPPPSGAAEKQEAPASGAPKENGDWLRSAAQVPVPVLRARQPRRSLPHSEKVACPLFHHPTPATGARRENGDWLRSAAQVPVPVFRAPQPHRNLLHSEKVACPLFHHPTPASGAPEGRQAIAEGASPRKDAPPGKELRRGGTNATSPDDESDEDKPPPPPRGETFEIAVPAGRHEIRVENDGLDWLKVSCYELVGTRGRPPARLMGLRGRRTVLAWLWNESHVWDRAILNTAAVELTNVSVELTDIPAGAWRVRPFDPWTGKWGGEARARVGERGRLKLALPRLRRDAAWRIERIDGG